MAEEKRQIKLLYCPATAKLVPYAASDCDRIDLGGIAKVFGLEPATVKIHGHFIGRGPDLIASSVTWKALISFFSGRGLPTGAHQPILVHGKILKPGSKRRHEPLDDDEPKTYGMDNQPVRDETSERMQHASVGPSKKCKLANTGSHGYGFDTADRIRCKRKHFLQDNLSLMKKLKIDT